MHLKANPLNYIYYFQTRVTNLRETCKSKAKTILLQHSAAELVTVPLARRVVVHLDLANFCPWNNSLKSWASSFEFAGEGKSNEDSFLMIFTDTRDVQTKTLFHSRRVPVIRLVELNQNTCGGSYRKLMIRVVFHRQIRASFLLIIFFK